MTRFTDFGFSYVVAFSDQGTANFLQSGYGCGISEQTTFHTAVRLEVGHSKGYARLRFTLADMKMLSQHWHTNAGILAPKVGGSDESGVVLRQFRSKPPAGGILSAIAIFQQLPEVRDIITAC